MDLARCPCSACFVARVRKRIEEGSSPIRVTEVTDELLKRVAADWTQFAGEPVRIEHIKGMLYGFCSELGALRIEHRYNLPRKRGRAQKSATEGWVYVLEI